MSKFKIFIFLLSLILLLAPFLSFAATTDYSVLKGGKPAQLGLSLYYLVDNVEERVFLPLGISEKFSTVQKADILKQIWTSLSFESPFKLIVKKFQKNKDLEVVFMLHQLKGSNMLFVTTNQYSAKLDRFLEDLSQDEAFATLFYVSNSKTTYYKDMYSKEREQALTKNKQWLNLADAYLMDELPENDIKIPALLDKIQNDPKEGKIEKFLAYLTEAQLMLIKGNIKGAEVISKNANTKIKTVPSADIKTANRILNYFRSKLEIMKAVQTKSR